MLTACLFILMFYLMSAALLLCFTTANPMLLVFWLLLTAVLGGLYMGTLLSSWLMYAFVLLYVGGMMVLFCYMVSLIFLSKVVLGRFSYLLVTFLLLFLVMSPALFSPSNSLLLASLYSWGNEGLLLFLSVYLLGVLITVVKLVTGWEGPMKTTLKANVSN